MKDILRVLSYLKPYWHFQVLFILGSLGYFSGDLALPWIEKLLIDDVLVAGNAKLLLPTTGLYLLTAAGMYLFSLGVVYFSTKVSESVSKDLQHDAYLHLRKLGFGFYDTQQTGRTMSLFNSDIPTAIGVRVLVGEYLINAAKLIISLIVVSAISWQLSVFSLLLVAVNVLIPIILEKPLRNIGEALQAEKAELSSALQEGISGSRELKGLGKEFFDLTKIHQSLSQLLSLNLKQVLVRQFGSLNTVLFWMATALIFWGGGRYVLAGRMKVGELFAITRYFSHVYQPLKSLIATHLGLPLKRAAVRRVFAFFDETEEESQGGARIKQVIGGVEFCNVSFGYREKHPVLKAVSFEAEPGETVAVVGPSGAGKSTLTNLIPRFYEPQQGNIFIDGMPIKDIQLQSLRDHIGTVFQAPHLFSESVAYNIRLGATDPGAVSHEEVVAAARLAKADDFIMNFPEQYETKIGERGVRLSGGEKQRVAIARVLIRKPKILILDEATSALDTASETLVQEALRNLMKNRTCFVVAHRLSTVLNADKILVLRKGRLIETGTHGELMRHGEVYPDLFEKQFAGLRGMP